MLYHNFLECLAKSTAMGACYEIDDVNKGRACVVAMRLARIPTTTLTWSSAYTIFISTVTLLVAAAFAHARERHAIHSTVHVAIQILHDTTYGNSQCKKSYLNFIHVNQSPADRKAMTLTMVQVLSERVTVPFDFAPFHWSTLSAEQSATTGGATTDQMASWCDSSPQDASELARLQLWPTRTDGGEPSGWGFDGGR